MFRYLKSAIRSVKTYIKYYENNLLFANNSNTFLLPPFLLLEFHPCYQQTRRLSSLIFILLRYLYNRILRLLAVQQASSKFLFQVTIIIISYITVSTTRRLLQGIFITTNSFINFT